MKDLADKLSEIQKNLNAPKSQFNSFSKYQYRNCEDILMALKPHMNGVFVTISDEIQMIGDRFYVRATATISNGTDSISCSAYAREALSKKGMDDSQLTGSTSSYARKYALNGLFLIDDNKDADSSLSEKTALTDQDKEWVMAVTKDPSCLGQIKDEKYKQFIKQQAGV